MDIQILEPFRRWLASTLDLEELSALLAIVRFTGAKDILEIGTYDGSTTLNLAANIGNDARVVTVDLPPQSAAGQTAIAVPIAHRNKTKHTIGERFAHSPHRSKIRQVFADSAALDWPSLGAFDLVLIDGCHYRDYVLSDSHHAFDSVQVRGVILWHDYGQSRDVSDVVDALATAMDAQKNGHGNARAFAIEGTRLAVAVREKGVKELRETEERREPTLQNAG